LRGFRIVSWSLAANECGRERRLRWPVGLQRKPKEAAAFYATLESARMEPWSALIIYFEGGPA
jgi:hypothetical protein